MFESLISSSVEPEVRKLLLGVKQALEGVEHRLNEQVATNDPITVLSASAQLNALHAWAPAIDDILKSLEPKPAAAPHAPSPLGHGH